MTTHPEETNERLSQKSQVYEKSERQGMEPYVSGDEFTVEIIRDLREVESVCEFWKTWQKTRDSSVDFFRPDWVARQPM